MPNRPTRIIEDALVESFDTEISAEDSAHVDHFATFQLRLRNERLSGPVNPESTGFYFRLPSCAGLRRSVPPWLRDECPAPIARPWYLHG